MTKAKQQKITSAILMEIASEATLIPIFPAGTTMGYDGRGPYILSNPAAVIVASLREMVELVIDRDHATDHLPPGQERPAAGWIKQLVEKDGGIFAEVDWTPKAKQQLTDKEYRYISPTFDFDLVSRQVLRIKRATLTNTPNFDMQAVASEGGADSPLSTPKSEQEETPEMTTKHQIALVAIATAMAMSADAAPEEIQATALSRLTQATETASQLDALRADLKLDDKADAKTVVATATAAIATPDAKKFVPMEMHQAALDKLKTLQTDTASQKATQLGDRVIQNLKEHGFAIVNKSFENTVGVKAISIKDDELGVYAPLFQQLGHDAAMHPDELVFKLFPDGFSTLCYDGQYFFDTDHPVINPDGTIASVSNSGGGAGAGWYLLDTTRPIKPFIYQKREEYTFKALDNPDDPNVFHRDEFYYGTNGRGAAGYGLWQLAYGSKQTLDAANANAGIVAMSSLKADVSGKPLGIRPNIIVVGPSNEKAAREVFERERDANGATNTMRGLVQVVVVPYLT